MTSNDPDSSDSAPWSRNQRGPDPNLCRYRASASKTASRRGGGHRPGHRSTPSEANIVDIDPVVGRQLRQSCSARGQVKSNHRGTGRFGGTGSGRDPSLGPRPKCENGNSHGQQQESGRQCKLNGCVTPIIQGEAPLAATAERWTVKSGDSGVHDGNTADPVARACEGPNSQSTTTPCPIDPPRS